MTIGFWSIKRYKKTILLLLLIKMNLKRSKKYSNRILLEIFTAVSANFGPSSVCPAVVVDDDGSVTPSASINGFFCLSRTSNGDCFSG